MKKFLIAGNIVDTDEERMTLEDVTPAQVNAFIKNLEPNEEVEFEITSFGGSCTAGIAIANMIRQASLDGHKSTAYVMGIAASMASVVACACDTLKIDNNAFFMCHLPWTLAEGNAIDLRKEADTLDKFRDALLAVYRTKFDTTDAVIIKMMEDETWFLGFQAEMFNLKCEVVFNEEPIKAAAFAKPMPKFNKTPKMIVDLNLMKDNMEKEELKEIKQPEPEKVDEDTTDAVEAETSEESVAEDKKETDSSEVATEEIVEEPVTSEDDTGEASVPKAEVEKRVSGMQSVMAKKMDAMKKDYEAKISEFNAQIKALNDELDSAKHESISVKAELERTKKELSDMTSAFEEKNNALASLHASVNTPMEQTNWKALKGKEFFDWYKKNHA